MRFRNPGPVAAPPRRLASLLGSPLIGLLLGLLLVVPVGCGGGGGGGGGGTDPATAQATFPADGSATDAALIQVTGTSDGTADISVNNVIATSDDGFQTWSSLVPLVDGWNDLVVLQRGVEVETITIDNRIPLISPRGIDVDPATGEIYLADGGNLLCIDPATGERTVVSGPSRGAGPLFNLVDDLEKHPTLPEVYLTNGGFQVFRIDLASGNRTPLVSTGPGSGEALYNLTSITYDDTIDQLLVGDIGLGAVFEVQLSDGDVNQLPGRGFIAQPMGIEKVLGTPYVLVADQNTADTTGLRSVKVTDGSPGPYWSTALNGAGPNFVEPSSVTHDPATQTAYVLDRQLGLVAVEMATNDRTLLAPFGGSFDRPITLAQGSGTVWTVEEYTGRVHEVTPSGDVLEAFGTIRGTGPSLRSPIGSARLGTKLRVADLLADSIIEVDLEDGSRRRITGPGVGLGPALTAPRDVCNGATADELYVLDDDLGVVRVDVTTGDRLVLVDDSVILPGTWTIAFDPVGDRVLIGYPIEGIVSADATTGDISGVSTPIVFPGQSIVDLVYDPTTDTALARIGNGSIESVDLATGDRTVLSDDTNDGPSLSGLGRFDLDDSGERAFVLVGGTVIEVDLATGDKALLSSSAGPGEGIDFRSPGSVAFDARTGGVLVGDRGCVLSVSRLGDRVIFSR